MIEEIELDRERLNIAAELRRCLERADRIGQAMAAIHIDQAIHILEPEPGRLQQAH